MLVVLAACISRYGFTYIAIRSLLVRVRESSYDTTLLARAHPAASHASYSSTPFYEPTKYIMPDPVAGSMTREALQGFDASEHVLLVALGDGPSFRESGRVSLARWEEPRGENALNRKDAVHRRFLSDFRKGL